MITQEQIIEERQLLIADWKALERTDSGQRILKNLSEFCGENKNPYVEGSFDLTSQKCGKLAVMLYIRNLLSSEDEPRQQESQNQSETGEKP